MLEFYESVDTTGDWLSGRESTEISNYYTQEGMGSIQITYGVSNRHRTICCNIGYKGG